MIDMKFVKDIDLVINRQVTLNIEDNEQVTLEPWDHLIVENTNSGFVAYKLNRNVSKKKRLGRIRGWQVNDIYNRDLTYRRFLLTLVDGQKQYMVCELMDIYSPEDQFV